MLNLIYSNAPYEVFKDNSEKKLILVPEQFSHNCERFLCELGGNTITKTAEVSSFKRISDKIFAEIGGLSKNYINDSGRILALFNAISNVFDELSIYKNLNSDSIDKILGIIDEFKIYSIKEDDLFNLSEVLDGNLKNKLRDLYFIYTEYNKITNCDIVDPRNQLEYLCENFNKSTILDDTHIYFVNFSSFTKQQYDLITEMLKKNIKVTIFLNIQEQNDKIYDLFCIERETLKYLKILCAKNNFLLNEQNGQFNNSKFDDIAQQIFEFNENVKPSLDLSLHISETAQKECMNVASEIIRLIRDFNYKFSDFIITTRNIDNYKNFIEIALNRYNIPFFATDTEKVINKPPVNAILDALNMISYDFERTSVFRYLKSPVSHISKADCDILEDYVIRWDIKYLNENLKFTANPSFKFKKTTENDQISLENLNQKKKFALYPVYKLKSALSKANLGKEFIEILYQYLLDIHLQASIIEYSKNLSDNQLKQQNLQIWDKIIDSIDQFYQICGEQKMNLDEFISLYSKTLISYEISTIPSSLDNVSIGDFEKIVCEPSKILFILGADSKNLPKKSSENSILTDFDREILELNEINLSPFGADLINNEFSLIYKVLTSPIDKIYISMSEISTSGDINLPSKIFEFLQKIGQDVTTDSQKNSDFMLNSKVTYLEYQALLGNFKAYENYDEILKKSEKTYDNISESNLENLYNKNISPSRIEVYNSCKFMYFLRYGLSLDERKVLKFDRLENGNFIHFVLEKILQEKNYSFDNLQGKIDWYINQYSTEFFSENTLSDERFLYNFNDFKKNIYAIVKNVIDEINSSEFEPCDFELDIRENSQITPLKIGGFNIVGKVDRVDLYESENSIHLRIIDYKSGVKKLDLSTLLYGINMQMMIYSLILQENQYYAKSQKHSDVDGILYIPTKIPKISNDIPLYANAREEIITSSLKRSGILLEDKEILRKMEKNNPFLYLPVGFTSKNEFTSASSVASDTRLSSLENLVEANLKSAITSIKNGEIEANPYVYDGKSPCNYCKFTNCCYFSDEYNKKREFEKLSKNDFFEKLGK